jgi:TonB family protein
MRQLKFLCLALAVFPTMRAQSSTNSLPPIPKDPLEILKAASPLYTFDDPQLKPWHLKGSYQLYNENGSPGDKGNYELWWVAPNTFRSSWSRSRATRNEWHTSDGRILVQATGEHLFYFEQRLQLLLISPLPDPTKFDPVDVKVEKDQLNLGKITFPCVTLSAPKRRDGTYPWVPGAGTGTFCFDSSNPVLRVTRTANVVYTEFDHLQKMQDRILAKEIAVTYGAQRVATFNIETVNGLASDESTIMPPAGAKESTPLNPAVSPSEAQTRLAKKTFPVYPPAAKAARITGTVVLDAWIGTDGKVKDVRVVGSPSSLLTSAAKDSVAQWQYEPYVVNGQPQEVNTLITVIFMMS